MGYAPGGIRRRRKAPAPAAPPPDDAAGSAAAAPAALATPTARPRILDAAAAARTRAILPRLEHARALLGDIYAWLSAEQSRISRRNRRLAAAEGHPAAAVGGAPARRGPPPRRPAAPASPSIAPSLAPATAALSDELAVRLAVLALAEASSWLARAGGSAPVLEAVPAAIPVLRRVSSALYGAYPAQSALLCEVSSVLGGVLADSAAVADARLDFGRSNDVSAAALAQAKLTAESKLEQLYPNALGARERAVTRTCYC